MKKFAIAAVVLAMAVSGAYAVSLSVPFFVDSAGNFQGGGIPAGPGTAAYIGIKNTTANPLTISVRYFAADGSEVTPANNTFELQAEQGVQWRPAQTDSVGEAASTDVNGFDLSAMNRLGVTATSGTNGSATITWSSGIAGDVVGRELEVTSGTGVRCAYTLPATN